MMVGVGTHDIFFPTDFDALKQVGEGEGPGDSAQMFKRMCGGESRVFKTGEFMAANGEVQSGGLLLTKEVTRCETRSGYNPLLEMYERQKVFVGKVA